MLAMIATRSLLLLLYRRKLERRGEKKKKVEGKDVRGVSQSS